MGYNSVADIMVLSSFV